MESWSDLTRNQPCTDQHALKTLKIVFMKIMLLFILFMT